MLFIIMYICVKPKKIKFIEMRRIYYLLIAGAFVFGVTSCKNEKENTAATETPVEATPISTESTNTSQEVALNPPHGQPGHRCDIPVGQPLTSGGNNFGSTPQNVQLTTPLMQENNQQGQGNINPPHGQPGHRCDIPVGQPLP